ncbi:hypothetical protein Q6314_27065, partial [Klebsiella pneumoniae]
GFSRNGFTSEIKAGEANNSGFTQLLVHFSLSLQNDFTLQCLVVCKTGEAEVEMSPSQFKTGP